MIVPLSDLRYFLSASEVWEPCCQAIFSPKRFPFLILISSLNQTRLEFSYGFRVSGNRKRGIILVVDIPPGRKVFGVFFACFMVNNDAAVHLLRMPSAMLVSRISRAKSSFNIVKHLLSLCIEARIPLSDLVSANNATEAQQTTVLRMTPDSAGCFIFEEGTTKRARLLGLILLSRSMLIPPRSRCRTTRTRQ